jgi:hypothetical protein
MGVEIERSVDAALHGVARSTKFRPWLRKVVYRSRLVARSGLTEKIAKKLLRQPLARAFDKPPCQPRERGDGEQDDSKEGARIESPPACRIPHVGLRQKETPFSFGQYEAK